MAQIGANCRNIADKEKDIEPNILPMHASMQDLKNGKWCCSEKTGVPGIISNVKMSKTGKHGHAKFTFNLQFPFTGAASQEMFPGHTHLKRPVMKKRECEVCFVDENDITFFNENDEEELAFMDKDYVDKSGKKQGELFHAEWESFDARHEAGEHDIKFQISLLEGPINAGKNSKWVRMVEKWHIKDDAIN